jgi:hypothetical protein
LGYLATEKRAWFQTDETGADAANVPHGKIKITLSNKWLIELLKLLYITFGFDNLAMCRSKTNDD